MSSPARDEIFTRIRSARAAGVTPAVPRAYRGPRGTGSVDLFVERVRDYRADVEKVALDDVARLLRARLVRRGATRVVAPEGFPHEWLKDVDGVVVRDSPELSTPRLDELDAVVSTCTVAIAETGTIVLTHDSGQGRRALTLVPDYHLVVVRVHQIVAGVPDAVARLDASSPMTWISGPSATSDIELSRVEGVHGPRTLDVLVVTG
ncbi:MAG: LUD domain-containing protein [Acidimicrobiales bacterium]